MTTQEQLQKINQIRTDIRYLKDNVNDDSKKDLTIADDFLVSVRDNINNIPVKQRGGKK